MLTFILLHFITNILFQFHILQIVPLWIPKRGSHHLSGGSKLWWRVSGSSLGMSRRPSNQPTNLFHIPKDIYSIVVRRRRKPEKKESRFFLNFWKTVYFSKHFLVQKERKKFHNWSACKGFEPKRITKWLSKWKWGYQKFRTKTHSYLFKRTNWYAI